VTVIVAVGSLKGSPGVTTLALALADRWPAEGGEPLVVEADPAGGDLAARFGLLTSRRGLVTLAAAGRRGSGGARPIEDHVHELPGGLEVIAAPAGAEQASQVLGELDGGGWALLWAAGRAADRPLVVDCGRLDAGTAVRPVLNAADVLLLVVRAQDDELSHLAARLPAIRGWALPAWYVVVVAPPGRSTDYRVRDISRVLGSRVLGPVPYDVGAAGVLAGRRRTRGGIGRSRLGRMAAGLGQFLAAGAPVEPWTPALPTDTDADVPAGRVAWPPTRTGTR
jgi:hypothetical protein